MIDSVEATAASPVMPQTVEALAYELWERRNEQTGSALEDWLEAERMLRQKMGQAA